MLKYYIKAREAGNRLLTDKGGIVSLEYVAVAFCIVAVVVAVFGTTSNSILGSALTNEIGKIVAKLP